MDVIKKKDALNINLGFLFAYIARRHFDEWTRFQLL